MKHDLFTDSQDAVEQTWAREIDKRFSFYAVFWSEIIGDIKSPTSSSQKLRGYGLRFPLWLTREKQDFILGQYKKICQTHYALFCHLAGAHYEISRLKRNRPRDSKHSFVYFETWGNSYYRMSSALKMIMLLWGWFYELRDESVYKPKSFPKLVKKQFEKDLDAFHLKQSYRELMRQVVHYQRAIGRLHGYAAKMENNRAYVPKTCKRRYPFFSKESFKDLVECEQKAAEDLEALEVFANCLHAEYLKSIKAWLENEQISIKYVRQTRAPLFEPTELNAEEAAEGPPLAASSLVESKLQQTIQNSSNLEKPAKDSGN